MHIRLAILLLLAVGWPGAVPAQPGVGENFCQENVSGGDPRGLQRVYCADGPARVALQGAHASARPVFYGAAPLAGIVGLIRNGAGVAEAYRLALTQGATYGTVLALKHAVGRPRPYLTYSLDSRSAKYRRADEGGHTSFPSGHAALSAGLVASWGLSYPRWYVVGPSAIWAAGVSLSRLHLGVHYPSDILMGALLGVAVAGAVHHARTALTPPRFRRDGPAASMGVPVGIRLAF